MFYFLTGIYTSSVYMDKLMKGDDEFVSHVFNGTATPIKTHKKPGKKHRILKGVNRAILILRNPFDVLRSEYKREKVGKTGLFTEEKLSGKYRFVLKLTAEHTNASAIIARDDGCDDKLANRVTVHTPTRQPARRPTRRATKM